LHQRNNSLRLAREFNETFFVFKAEHNLQAVVLLLHKSEP
jgi:hypothetical protein